MQCRSCKTPNLETDTRCVNCRRLLVDAPPERSAAHFCGFLLAAVGAAVFTFGPSSMWIHDNAVLRAGIGGIVGGIIGAIVGLFIDQVEKSDTSAPAPSRVRIPPINRE